MAHMDADDCFYVATATTDVYTDTIFEVDSYTGTAYRALPRRYVLSPFPVFLAVVSQLSGRLHPAVMAHMVFPAVFLSMAYMVQAVLAKNGFPEKKGPGDLSSSGSLYLQFFRLFCLQCGKLSDGSYLAGKSCFGFRTFAVSALFVYIVFPRKKAGDILGSTGACQYKLLPSVLYGSDTCTSFDRLLFYHFPDCQERLETGIGRIFMLPAFHCPGDRVYFNGLTGGWK